MRPSRFRALAGTAIIVVAIAACGNPRTESNVAQALNDAANEIGGLKNDIAQLSVELDSLRHVVAKQDSTLARIAAVNNIPISR